ncbi:MAG: hypothetical protein H5U37_01135 [Caldisericia bacterium]|nr:hypothetical protein [Caldisericia bacterium]
MIEKVNEKIDILSDFLKKVNLNFNILPGVEKAKDIDEARKELTLLFYVDAICHQTQNFFGEIDGVFYKGWDYLLFSFKKEFKKDKEFITTKRMKKIKGEDLKRILNGSGDRYYERAKLLRNCAFILERDFKGDIFEINRVAEGYIKRDNKPDLIKLFHKFKAYSDPLSKKTYLFINIANKIGFWEIKDPHNLWTPVDYHLERVSLRIGIVKIDESLKNKLYLQKRVPQTIDLKLREKIGESIKELSNRSGVSIDKLDQFFWSLGRSICLKDYPSCEGVLVDNTFTQITGISLKDGCPFRNLCDAYKNKELRNLKESNVYTIYY